MSGTKVVVVVLVLIAVLFVVLVVLGAGKNKSEPKPTAENFKAEDHSTLGSFNNVLARFGPKFEAKELQPPQTSFDLRTQPLYNLKVLGDTKHKFRQAKFVVQPSTTCANVSYNAYGTLPKDTKNPQEVNGTSDPKHPTEFTFTMFEGGGTLTIGRSLAYAGSCKITLE